MAGRILGIDLGTTNSLAAVYDEAAPLILTSFEGDRLIPSAVAFTEKGELLVGEHAKRQAVLNPQNTVLSVKRIVGRKFYTEEVQRAVAGVSVPVTADERGDIVISMLGKDFSPEEISAIILRRLKELAEEQLQEEVAQAVITVPAYFDFSQRQATRNAGRIAHLDVVRVLSEPTAAAIAFGIGREGDRRVAVYDLGGGTFDIAILDVSGGLFEVLAVSGDNQLGGDDFDRRIVGWILEQWRRQYGDGLEENPVAMQRIREAAEYAKRDLTLSCSTTISIPFLTSGADGKPCHLRGTLTRAAFDELVGDLVDRTFAKCDDALRQAKTKVGDVTDVILVGGQSRSPIVYEKVARYFGKMPLKGVHPDEAVATGAAIQGAVIAGQDLGVSLMDVTAFSLGAEVDGGKVSILIPRNTPIPMDVSRVYTTFHDDQEFVTVNILQGESPYAAYNRSLVKFDLAPIPPAPKGTPDIEVTFSVDTNGILDVTAIDKGSDREQNVRIAESNMLTLRQIEVGAARVEGLMKTEQERRELTVLKNHGLYLVARLNAFMVSHGKEVGERRVARLTHCIGELERIASFEDPGLRDAARRVLEREQEWFEALAKKHARDFEIRPLPE